MFTTRLQQYNAAPDSRYKKTDVTSFSVRLIRVSRAGKMPGNANDAYQCTLTKCIRWKALFVLNMLARNDRIAAQYYGSAFMTC